MAIQLLLYGPLKKYAKNIEKGENGLLYPYKQNITARKVLDDLGISFKNVSFIIVNQTKYKLETPLEDGDCVKILPKILGG